MRTLCVAPTALLGACWMGACVIGCSSPPDPPETATPPRTTTTTTATSSPSPHAARSADTRHVTGVFYEIDLPAGAVDAVPSAPDVIDSVYRLSAEDDVTLTFFRPMPRQGELDAWNGAVTALLDGIPAREDEGELAGVPARVTFLPGELRWTAVVDGQGLLLKCFTSRPEDEAWMHAHCDETVSSLTLRRPIP
ncbi:MAG: hypothetical protein K1X94_11535 [Sandaracinaceae bacterium]|nr:hypothetical protein [Sandaracinaceae bacterium]